MSAAPSTIQQISAGAGHLLIFGPLGLAFGLVALVALMCLLQRLVGVSRADRAKFALRTCYAIMARLTKRLDVPPSADDADANPVDDRDRDLQHRLRFR
jgi:hypothetical protein